MESKVLQVFYGNDCLPYKDSNRAVHFPIVGNAFQGANNTTEIRFYYGLIGGDDTTWIAVTKLPNGKVGSKVLTSHLDTTLNEYYAKLELSSFYTQYKGDVYISLQGYQGGVQVTEDDDVYTITGTPTIRATGSVKLAINYATQFVGSGEEENVTLQEIFGYLATKLDINKGITLVSNIDTADLSGYDEGQLLYCLTNKQYYEKIEESPYYQVAENGNGILGSKRTLVRYYIDFTTTKLINAINLINGKLAIICDINTNVDYLIQDSASLNVRIIRLTDLYTWNIPVNLSTGELNIDEIIVNTYLDRIIHNSNLADYGVPYTGATDNVDLDTYDITAKAFNVKNVGSLEKYNSDPTNYDLKLIARFGKLVLVANDIVEYLGSEIANKTWANQQIADAIATVKANAFIVVDTTIYPTLNSFLASTGEEGYIYLYPSTIPAQGYLQYIWEGNDWLEIGTTQLDLSDYYTKSQVNTIANGKVDKTSSASKVYGTNASGNQTTISFTSNNSGSTIPLRDNDGNIGVALTPTDNTHATSKKYVDDQTNTRVAQSSEHNKVYGTDNSGNQKLFDVDNTVGADGNIVRRASGTSQIMVPLTPTANGHASSKKYVDDSIASAISTVFKYKGTKTVAEINALTGLQVGDVYNVSDSGTLTAGNIQVRAGDNVAWTGTAWDKLAEDIDWSAYDEKFIAAGFFEVDNYNENSGEITFVFATELYDMSYNSDTGVMTIEAI